MHFKYQNINKLYKYKYAFQSIDDILQFHLTVRFNDENPKFG